MKIKAAVLHDYNQDFVIEDVELAEPSYNQVLVKIAASGLCHSDYFVRNGFRTPMPAVLGHEGSGIVERVGPGVNSIKPGDHVVLSYPSCGECPTCLTGRANFCHKAGELSFDGRMLDGSTPVSQDGKPLSVFFGQGSFATHCVTSARNVVKVDFDVDLRLLGPLGCGIQTGAGVVINTFNPQPGSAIAVFGTGSVGLSALMAAKACGCTVIIAVDIFESRLEKALELGATNVVNSGKISDIAREILKIYPAGLHFAFDTTGAAICVKAALGALRTCGHAAGVAISTEKMEIDGWTMLFKSKTWKNVIQGDAIPQVFVPQMIDMYKAGIFPFDKLMTFFDFADINEAFKANHDGTAVKPILVMP
jgi:aryl-alcohol dehydrogenase